MNAIMALEAKSLVAARRLITFSPVVLRQKTNTLQITSGATFIFCCMSAGERGGAAAAEEGIGRTKELIGHGASSQPQHGP